MLSASQRALFLGSVGGLAAPGLLGWRRRRKANRRVVLLASDTIKAWGNVRGFFFWPEPAY